MRRLAALEIEVGAWGRVNVGVYCLHLLFFCVFVGSFVCCFMKEFVVV